MNIFESIGRVSRRYEPYHSQFLADALESSLKGDTSLFNALWRLAAPPDWETPDRAVVSTEEVVETGRIDVCIRSDYPYQRILGIEIKTDDASAQRGQLGKYLKGLIKKFPEYDVQVSYLTPFNRKQAGEAADSLRAVQAFEEFAVNSPRSKHISWLDVATITWDGNHLWNQHQAYVRSRIASLSELQAKSELNRGFAAFFGSVAAEQFLETLSDLGVHGTKIDLSEFKEPDFAKSLSGSIEKLLDTDNVLRNVRRHDSFESELRHRFLDSRHREVHKAMFCLSRRFPFVWVQGKRNYGIRTAHRNHSNGVSLLRSVGPDCLVVGERR